LVIAALCLAASIAYLSRNCLSVAVAEGSILKDLNCTEMQMGWVMGFGLFMSYAVFQIPSGWLGQTWGGSRRVLPLFSIAWSLLTGLMAVATGFYSLFATYLGIGAAQAGIFPNSADTIKKWFPSARIAFVCGALASFMSIGGAIASAVSGLMLDQWHVSWRWVFVLFSLPGLFWAVGFYLWFRNRPGEHKSVNLAELNLIRGTSGEISDAKDSEIHAEPLAQLGPQPIPWAAIRSSPSMWAISGQQFFRAAGYIFYGTWFPKYLKETRGVSIEEAGYLSALPLLAVVVASMLAGILVDWTFAKTGSRRWSRQFIAVVSMLSCAGFIFLAYFAADAITAVLLISAGSFCASFAGPCAYVATIDMADRQVPIVFSTMNMAGNLGAAACPIVVIWFVERTGNWDYVLFFFVGVYIAAAICWGLLDPNRTIFNEASGKDAAAGLAE